MVPWWYSSEWYICMIYFGWWQWNTIKCISNSSRTVEAQKDKEKKNKDKFDLEVAFYTSFTKC